MTTDFYDWKGVIAESMKADPGYFQSKFKEQQERDNPNGKASLGTVGQFPAPTWPVLDKAALHGLAGDIVRNIDPYTEADKVATLGNVLGALGNIFGRRPHHKVLFDQHAGRLFILNVGATGNGRKGLGWSPVGEICRRVDPAWHSGIGGTLSSGEGLISAVRDPVIGRKKNRSGAEIETVEDPGVLDKRLLITETEFVSVLKMIQREGNTLSPILRQAWDGITIRPMTKNNRISATAPHISIIGHITPEELLRNLTETELANGLANRFIFLLVQRSKLIPNPQPIPEELMELMVKEVEKTIQASENFREMKRSPEAEEYWASKYEELSTPKPGLIGCILSRAVPQVLRVSVTYALLGRSDTIDLDHLKAALAFWKYSEDSVRWIFRDKTGDAVADQILNALRDRPNGMSRTEIYVEVFQKHKASEIIESALNLLERMGRVHKRTEGTEGRSKETWFYGATERCASVNGA